MLPLFLFRGKKKKAEKRKQQKILMLTFFFSSMKGALLSFKLELQINAGNYRFREKQPRICNLLLDSGKGTEI